MTRAALLAGVLLLLSGCRSARPSSSPEPVRSLEDALAAEGEDFGLRWRLASACLELVEHPARPEREWLGWAERALAHADRAIELEAERVEGHYYRAVALGRVLKHSTLPALSRIGELEAAGVRAREIDPSFRRAGPLRLLALLYFHAPSWPVGPELAGDEEEIEELFREALALAPDCAENHLGYAQFLLEQDRKEEALEASQRVRELLPQQDHLLPHERAALEHDLIELTAALAG